MTANFAHHAAMAELRKEQQLRELIQEAITVAEGMPEETRCGILVQEYADHANVSVAPDVPYGQVHRLQYLG